MAVRSLTVWPEVVPPNKNEKPLPTRFCGLSLDLNRPENILNQTSPLIKHRKAPNRLAGALGLLILLIASSCDDEGGVLSAFPPRYAFFIRDGVQYPAACGEVIYSLNPHEKRITDYIV
jgi:hypothetical protein